MEGIIQDLGGLRVVQVRINEVCSIVLIVSVGSRVGSWVFRMGIILSYGQNTIEVYMEDIYGNTVVLWRVFILSSMYGL
jgi:hypothetical protein